jgi:aminodeoxyfutalosine deaminase
LTLHSNPDTTVDSFTIEQRLAAMPKAELHLHLEGSIDPPTVVELAARHGYQTTEEEVAARYAPGDFAQFIDAFKWVTSFLRKPADYALIAHRVAKSLRAQNVVYAEITLSAGVMLFRKQDPAANFEALREAAAEVPGIRCAWIFDAVRQWGPNAAMEVARIAAQLRSPDIVAFGIGGDELSIPTSEFRGVYYYAATQGLHRLMHAGEIGGPENVYDAVEILGAERIGHGIAVMRDPRVMDFLAARGVALEVCPTSNLRTGALARQLGRPASGHADHPLPSFVRRGLPITLSSDDPAMFETSLTKEYLHAREMGLGPAELARLAEASFQHAFLSSEEKSAFLHEFHSNTAVLGLL